MVISASLVPLILTSLVVFKHYVHNRRISNVYLLYNEAYPIEDCPLPVDMKINEINYDLAFSLRLRSYLLQIDVLFNDGSSYSYDF